jgi:hypothetical protein
LISLPSTINSKSKIFYAYVMEYLMNIIDKYSNMIIREGFITFSLAYIDIDEGDKHYFNERIKFISEEDNLKMYERINYYEEKYRTGDIYVNNINLIQLYLSEYKLLCDHHAASIYLALEKKDIIFVADVNGALLCYDNDFKVKFEIELLGYFAIIMHLLNDNKEDEKLDTRSCISITVSNFPKTSLKPFNRNEILFHEKCEVDWGEKKVTRKDIKKRSDYIMNRIKLANQELRENIEEQIIKGNIKKERTIWFNLPIDFNSIMAGIKKKIYKN